MYHSIHAYQNTESSENHQKDFRCQSENGIQYILSNTYQYNYFYKQSLDSLSFKGKYNTISVNESHMRERERNRHTNRQTDRQTKNGG